RSGSLVAPSNSLATPKWFSRHAEWFSRRPRVGGDRCFKKLDSRLRGNDKTQLGPRLRGDDKHRARGRRTSKRGPRLRGDDNTARGDDNTERGDDEHEDSRVRGHDKVNKSEGRTKVIDSTKAGQNKKKKKAKEERRRGRCKTGRSGRFR